MAESETLTYFDMLELSAILKIKKILVCQRIYVVISELLWHSAS